MHERHLRELLRESRPFSKVPVARRSALTGLLLSATIPFLAGCSRYVILPEWDADFVSTLGDLASDPNPKQLADLTDFDWDRVLIFAHSQSAEEVNSAVGASIMRRGWVGHDNSLLVFLKDDEVVKVMDTNPPLITTGSGTHDAYLVPTRLVFLPSILELVEPDEVSHHMKMLRS